MSSADGSRPDLSTDASQPDASQPLSRGSSAAQPAAPEPTASTGPGVTPLPTSVVLPTTVPPLDVDGTTAVAIGTALWGVASLVLLVFFRDQLTDAGNGWWLWACLAGFGLGMLGFSYCLRRRDRSTARQR